MKLVAVRAAAPDAHGRELPDREPGSVSYTAAIESAASRGTDTALSPVAERVVREAARRRFDHARR
ncbi:MAG: hypothetical protein OXH75_25485 [Acidobacteria bacterium]|nr:hypothetical protein [Acidobacteriota bacterium]